MSYQHLKDYLNKHGESALEQLHADYAVKVKTEDGLLFCLNYCQIDSPKNPITNACRGSIVYFQDGEWKFACTPPLRFFNLHEGHCLIDDLIAAGKESEFEYYEKRDGSFIKLFFNPFTTEWQLGTRGTATIKSECNSFGDTFESLIQSAIPLHVLLTAAEVCCDEKFTYCYEITSPKNRIVTPYGREELKYLCSYSEDGEVDSTFKHQCKEFPFSSIEEAVEASKSLKGLQEGFVVYHNGIPVGKIKSPLYVTTHHLRGEGLNHRRCLELLLSGEVDEYLAVFPEDEVLLRPYIKGYNEMLDLVSEQWVEAKNLSGKEIATSFKDSPVLHVLFGLGKHGGDVRKLLSKALMSWKRDLLEKFINKEGSI